MYGRHLTLASSAIAGPANRVPKPCQGTSFTYIIEALPFLELRLCAITSSFNRHRGILPLFVDFVITIGIYGVPILCRFFWESRLLDWA